MLSSCTRFTPELMWSCAQWHPWSQRDTQWLEVARDSQAQLPMAALELRKYEARHLALGRRRGQGVSGRTRILAKQFRHWEGWAGFTVWIFQICQAWNLGAWGWAKPSVVRTQRYHCISSGQFMTSFVSRSCRFNETWPWQFWNCLKYWYLFACCCDLIHYIAGWYRRF